MLSYVEAFGMHERPLQTLRFADLMPIKSLHFHSKKRFHQFGHSNAETTTIDSYRERKHSFIRRVRRHAADPRQCAVG
jgi:hypothetical protein